MGGRISDFRKVSKNCRKAGREPLGLLCDRALQSLIDLTSLADDTHEIREHERTFLADIHRPSRKIDAPCSWRHALERLTQKNVDLNLKRLGEVDHHGREV